MTLIPKSRVHLTRFHAVFAPHSAWRAQVTQAKPGQPDSKQADKTPAERHAAMTWAPTQRVFDIDIEICEHCGSTVKISSPASKTQPVIKTILDRP